MNAIEIKILTTADRGLMYAEACFETFCVVDGEVLMLSFHVARMQSGLAAFGVVIETAVLYDVFMQCIALAENNILMRLTFSGGEAGWGLSRSPDTQVQVYVQMMPMVAASPVTLNAVEYSFPLKKKYAKFTSDYGEMLRASQAWLPGLPGGSEALLCCDGRVLGTMMANVAIFDGQHWKTPTGVGVLSGTVRQLLLDKGAIVQDACHVQCLEGLESMVCLNSGRFIRPVQRLGSCVLDIDHPALERLYAILREYDGVPGDLPW